MCPWAFTSCRAAGTGLDLLFCSLEGQWMCTCMVLPVANSIAWVTSPVFFWPGFCSDEWSQSALLTLLFLLPPYTSVFEQD